MSPPEDHVRALIDTYHDFNPSVVDELPLRPSPLQFMRYVARNRPFVVRRGASSWRAVQAWDAGYLRKVMSRKSVQVAVTPNGNADSVVEDDHGRLLFVEPYEVEEPFDAFLDYVQNDTMLAAEKNPAGREVKYAQTQNDNLRGEYADLSGDVPASIDFVDEALDAAPDAVNVWIGNERSVTSLHKDNYENIYVQVRGRKHFVLLAPVEMPCVNEAPIPFARYHPTPANVLEPRMYQDRQPVPVALWDPDRPGIRASRLSDSARPLRISLDEGDMMYLPALWYHKVSQTSGQEGFSCSVNFWYDMDFSGPFWTQQAFLHHAVAAASRQVDYPCYEDQDQEATKEA